MSLMDTIWTRPQEYVCVFVSICLTLVEQTTRLILWWSAFTACVLRPVVGRTVAILGSCILSSILLIHPQVSRRWSLCVCLCVCMRGLVSGEPLGERQGSHCPWQPWGRVWPSRTRVLGHSQNSRWLPSLCPIVPSHLLHVSLPSTRKYTDLPLTLRSPEFFSSFCFLHIPFCYLFICLGFSLFLPLSCCLLVFVCLCRSLSLPQYFGKVVFLH